jgi:hypothetical protein
MLNDQTARVIASLNVLASVLQRQISELCESIDKKIRSASVAHMTMSEARAMDAMKNSDTNSPYQSPGCSTRIQPTMGYF